jgi:hypothetical protein
MTREAPDLYFDLNSHVLRTRERQRLDQIAPALQDMLHDSPELIIVIEGHCDDWGVHEYNQQLGLDRAEAVRRNSSEFQFSRRPRASGQSRRHCAAVLDARRSVPPEEPACSLQSRTAHIRRSEGRVIVF